MDLKWKQAKHNGKVVAYLSSVKIKDVEYDFTIRVNNNYTLVVDDGSWD